MYDLEDNTSGRQGASSRASNAQVIGSTRSKQETRQTTYKRVSSSTSANNANVQWCPRLIVVVLAMTAAAACAAAASHVHKSSTDADLREQIQNLRRENQVLSERAKLAQSEQQDLAQIILDPNARSRLVNMMQRSDAFDETIRRNGFKSGPENTVSVRRCLGRALFELNISSVLDVPCGDGTWQTLIPGIANVTYVGADINLRALEKAKHSPNAQAMGMDFMLFDPIHFPLKRAFDLVLFRDAAEQHQVRDTLTAVLNFKSSGSRYLAATYWPGSSVEANLAAINLPHAGWYEANLMAQPFNFPKPLAWCENADEGSKFHGRSRLGIWRLKDLPTTAKDVQAATPQDAQTASRPPQKQRMRSGQRTRTEQLPPEVHVSPASRQNTQPTRKRRKEVTLDDLLNSFGSAFAPQRDRWSKSKVEESSPFDGLFNNFLETPGRVERWGHRPSQRSHPLSDFFQIPGFDAFDSHAMDDDHLSFGSPDYRRHSHFPHI